MLITIYSWNVNGIRAVYKKGFLEWFLHESPDILCLQETKAHQEQLPKELLEIDTYRTYFSGAERKGYSGVGLYSKIKPLKVMTDFGVERFATEGRILITHYPFFILCNVYFPNGNMGPERLQYKLDFYDAFLGYLKRLKKKNKKIIVCGDINTAHTELDLSRPKQNENVSGFLPIERAWIDKLIRNGFVDTFRLFEKQGGHYTWWDFKTHSRERNVGWRLDYFFVSKNLTSNIQSSFMRKDVMGSDHCPIGITLKL